MAQGVFFGLRAVFESHKLSLEPQESTNPSKLSGMQTVNCCFELVEMGKTKGRRNSEGHCLFFFFKFCFVFLFFFLLNARGNQYFILIPLQTRTPSPLILDQNYINTKNQVIKAERRVLKELGFCVHVKHPHKVSFFSFFFWVITF